MINMDELVRTGIALVDPMTSGEIGDVLTHLSTRTVYKGHVQVKAKGVMLPCPADAAAARWPVFSPTMRDVVTAPHLFEMALETLPIAREYFGGERPLLYSMNCFWSHPSDEVYQDTHGWHSDGDDRKQLVLFVYGTDVMSAGEGAHLYRLGSMGMPGPADQCPTREILGPAGTAFMADTNGIHMGLRPNKLRMLAWARWGVSDPPGSYVWDELSPVPRDLLGDRYPSDPVLRDAIHLVVA